MRRRIVVDRTRPLRARTRRRKRCSGGVAAAAAAVVNGGTVVVEVKRRLCALFYRIVLFYVPIYIYILYTRVPTVFYTYTRTCIQ